MIVLQNEVVLFYILSYVHPRIPAVATIFGRAYHLSQGHRIQRIGVVAIKLGRCLGIVEHQEPRVFHVMITKFRQIFEGRATWKVREAVLCRNGIVLGTHPDLTLNEVLILVALGLNRAPPRLARAVSILNVAITGPVHDRQL